MDSRVAPEIVFDQGLGELFVVRVGGNVAGELELASIAVTLDLGVSLVVVLGHTDCKAVARSLTSDGRGVLFDMIREHQQSEDPVRDNALGQAEKLRRSLPVRVVAGVYDVATGRVTFLD